MLQTINVHFACYCLQSVIS